MERDSIDIKSDFYDKVHTAEKIKQVFKIVILSSFVTKFPFSKQLGSFDNRVQIAKSFWTISISSK